MTDEQKQFQEYFTNFLEQNQAYFHGTSTALGLRVGNKLLPPQETKVLREVDRTDYQDVIFCTNSIEWAKKWAYKAVQQFGGVPIVFLIEPDKHSLAHRMNAEYTANYAKIKGIMVE